VKASPTGAVTTTIIILPTATGQRKKQRNSALLPTHP
jgi:hypothetical protein